ncbi:hypothetical protein AVEN_42472-1 [Araneus ventricosus]|uniref:Uncharacterized protein n=1 Tax=Araneus ventricosus TaxID=182803 RepID=A0A4Y2MZG8_ARAVE|nr:hypothetical protein AVEN_42472-1 [Araneus ventricosus]
MVIVFLRMVIRYVIGIVISGVGFVDYVVRKPEYLYSDFSFIKNGFCAIKPNLLIHIVGVSLVRGEASPRDRKNAARVFTLQMSLF